MNADQQRVRRAKLFKKIPERAFERVNDAMKVRAFASRDVVLSFNEQHEFSQSYGYIVTGDVLFLDKSGRPIGLAVKDEFFLGRPFTLNEKEVDRAVSLSENTFVVYLPREIFTDLAKASPVVSQMIADIYEGIFERSTMMANDVNGMHRIQQWLRDKNFHSPLSAWIDNIEEKRKGKATKRSKERRRNRLMMWLWIGSFVLFSPFLIESFQKAGWWDLSFLRALQSSWAEHPFRPGAPFNLLMGEIGFGLLFFTNALTIIRWGIRSRKWGFDLRLHEEIHALIAVFGTSFVLLHVGFFFRGGNVEHFAYACLVITLVSGLIGSFFHRALPRTIEGEKLKLEHIHTEQKRLRDKAAFVINDPHIFKTSIALMNPSSKERPSLKSAPFLFFKVRKLKKALADMGMEKDSANLAAHYIFEEFKLKHKMKLLEGFGVIINGWMIFHQILAYSVFVLAGIHVLLVTVLA